MKTQTLPEAPTSIPFTLNFVERLNKALYDDAIKSSEIVKESYDPETQTSNVSIYAGTSLTYTDTTSGFLLGRDDSKESDT